MNEQIVENSKTTGNESMQFLSFSLGEEDYGIDILRVQEIRGWEEVRQIPNMPEYIKGVMNLRDSVVPIIDLRIRFGQKDVVYSPTTVIIVLTVERGDEIHVVGVVVDSVSDVLDIKKSELRDAPNFGTKINTRYINGMVMLDKRMVILLDSDNLFNPDELAELEQLPD